MRVRMLDRPEVIAYINENTVPVMWTTTARGLPDLPAFSWWARCYKENPWPHIAFAVFCLLDADGSRIYGSSGCGFVEKGGVLSQGFDNLQLQMARYRIAVDLKTRHAEKPGAATQSAIDEHLAAVERALRDELPCFDDVRLQTCRSLLGRRTAKWPEVLAALAPRPAGETEVVEPGMRVAVIRTLGDLLLDDRPFAPQARGHLEQLYRSLAPGDRVEWRRRTLRAAGKARLTDLEPGDAGVPPTILPVAARSLVTLAELPLDPDAPDLVEAVSDWWKAHRDDTRYAPPWL